MGVAQNRESPDFRSPEVGRYATVTCILFLLRISLPNQTNMMRIQEFYYIHFEITGDPCNLINSQITLFFALNHICSKSHYSCSKSDQLCFKLHHSCTISHHFRFEYKISCNLSLFVSAIQQIGYLINKIMVMTEFCDFKMAVIKRIIELHVVQFWSEIILMISNRTILKLLI